MRVLLVPYPGTWEVEGGHRTQQMQTARALRRAGVDAAIGDVGLAQAERFDVVHFFGDPRPLLEVGRPGGRLVVSPVHFPASIELGSLPWRGGRIAASWNRLRHVLRGILHPRGRMRRRAELNARLDAIASTDAVVTNSQAEAELLSADAGRRRLPPMHVAHSGVDERFFGGIADLGRRLVGDPPFVLCVGRIEPIKNQVTLCHAMRAVPARLVLVGSVLPGNEGYLAECRRVLPSLMHLDHVDREELPHVYAAATCHVLPSWFETTGLATLEALAAGTPCVAGHSPCVEDYFRGHVELVPPGDLTAMRAAIERALQGPRGDEREHARRFSWDRTARELIIAYDETVHR